MHLLTVFGATGAQGGALIDYVLEHSILSKKYCVRAVTRDVGKEAAVKLAGRGVEVVRADMDDPASLEKAVEGSYAVFAMTNYWEKGSPDVEIAQGKAMADASVAAGTSLLIWSSLPNVTQMTNGKLTGVKHFDSKAEVETYIRGLPIKAAFYMPAFYMQNFQGFFRPKENDAGDLQLSLTWTLHTPIPLIDITDTGKFLAPILLSDPSKYNGANFTAATAFYTAEQMIAGWTKVTGKKVVFAQIEPGISRPGLPPAVIKSMKENVGLIKDYHYYGRAGKRDLEWTLEQVQGVEGVELTVWEEFVERNGPWF